MMKVMTIKRIFAAILICVIMTAGCGALADQVLVTATANVYATPGDTTSAIGSLSEGTMLNRVAQRNGWSMVTMNGATAFMTDDTLAKITTMKAVGYTTAETAILATPAMGGSELKRVPAGATVLVGGVAGQWAYVCHDGTIGYTLLSTLTPNAPAQPQQPQEPQSNITYTNVTMYAAHDNAKVYNTKAKVIGTVPLNTALNVTALCGDLAMTNVGIMYKSDLSDTKTETQNGITYFEATPFYIAHDNAKAYNTKAKVIGTLPLNTVVTATACCGDLVLTNAGILYKSDLSTEKTEVKTEPQNGITYFDAIPFYVAKDNAKVYNTKGKVIGALPLNTVVTATAYCGELVLTNAGIMYKSDLSSTKAEEPFHPTTAYAAKDNAKVYNTGAEVIGTLPLNTAVTVTAVNGDLAMTNVGIMYLADLSATKTEVKAEPKSDITYISPTTFYVQKDNASAYNASGSVIGKLPLNTAVTVSAYNPTMALVNVNGVQAMMSVSDLGADKVVVTIKRGDKGDAVVNIQKRMTELGWFGGSTAGNYLDITENAVKAFQKASGLPVTGECDAATLAAMFSDNAVKYTIPNHSNAKPATGTAKAMDWWKSDIQKIFARGTVATITDVETGIAWYEQRSGGTNHADCQPCTAADTAAMKKACGSWSWARRAIFVTINGVNYAASMNCQPHSSGSISGNNFDGHHCIHFTNSRTHGTNSVCSLHQAAIKKAANTTL